MLVMDGFIVIVEIFVRLELFCVVMFIMFDFDEVVVRVIC